MHSVERTLLWTTRIGVFLMPFIPLVISASMLFPFITGKNFAFRIITEIIFAAWLLLMLRVPRFRPRKSLLLWGLAVFLGAVLLADIFAANPFKAFWSNFERMEGFITLLHLGAYFLVASSVLDSEKLWHRFFATSVGVSAFLGVYGILQLAGKIVINQGGVRLDGTFGNATYFAGYMLFHIFLTLFLLFRHKVGFSLRFLYGGALFLQVFTLYFTATRGAGLGLIGGLALAAVIIAALERENPRLRRGALVVLVVLVALVGAFAFFKESGVVTHSPVLSRFASISVSAAKPRFLVWGMAWQGFKEHPALGWGQEGFNYVFNKYYNPKMWGQEQWFDRTHDIFLDWLISAGLAGLLSYLALFYFLLRYLWRRREETLRFSVSELGILTGLVAGYLIHNFFVFDNIGSYLLFFSLLAFAHARVSVSVPFLASRPALPLRQPYFIAASLIAVALVAGVYFLNVRGIIVAHALIDGLQSHKGDVSKNLAAYKTAFAHETVGTQEVAEQTMQAAASVAGASNVSDEVKREFVTFAVSAMERELVRAPEDARLHVFTGTFFSRLGAFDRAAPHLETAHSLSPSKQTISFELASAYFNLGRKTEALALLRSAFESEPDFQLARLTYAAGAIYAGEFALAEELISPAADAADFDDRILKAYFDVKRYDAVHAIWERRVEKQPQNARYHIGFAASLILLGERQRALTELQTAKTLDPELKNEVDGYLSELKAGKNP